MTLTKKFIDAYKREIRSKSGNQCARCGSWHATSKCTKPVQECYRRGLGNLENDQNAKGKFEENVKEAEEIFQEVRDEMKKGDKEKADVKAKAKSTAVGAKPVKAEETTPRTRPSKQLPLGQSPYRGYLGGKNAQKYSDQPARKQIPAESQVEKDSSLDPSVGKIHCEFENHDDNQTEFENFNKKVRRYGVCEGPQGRVMTNYVEIEKAPNNLYIYSLNYWCLDPDNADKKKTFNKKGEIGECFKAMHQAKVLNLGSVRWATDFRNLWTDAPLREISQSTWQTAEFSYIRPNGTTVTNMRTDVVKTGSLENIMEALRNRDLHELSEYLRALNAQVGQSFFNYSDKNGKHLKFVGANKCFLPQACGNIEQLIAKRGYFTSVRPSTSGMLLNINTATSAFLPPIRVSEFLRKENATLKSNSHVEKLLKGAMLRIIHERPEKEGTTRNSEAARLKSFVQFGASAKEQKFYTLLKAEKNKPRKANPNMDGETVQNFFKKMPHQDVDDLLDKSNELDLLCVNVGNRVNTPSNDDPAEIIKVMREQSEQGAQWIPACLLEIVPNQIVKTTLNPTQTSKMITLAARLPATNAGLIVHEGLEILGVGNSNFQKTKDEPDFKIKNELISLPLKFLDGLSVQYGNGKGKSSDLASWNVANTKFMHPKAFNKIHFLGLNRCLPRNKTLANCMERFTGALPRHGMHGNSGKVFQLGNNVEVSLKSFFQRENIDYGDCSIVLLFRKDLDSYATIKREMDLAQGKHSLCAVGNRFEGERFVEDFLSNLALKLNLKKGGVNHELEGKKLSTYLGSERHAQTMIFGADVTHPGAGAKQGSPSIACIVGSKSRDFMNYYGSMRLQAGGQERIEDAHLMSMVKEQLLAWKADHGELPKAILFYRDGVSESQFEACKFEIDQIKRAHTEAGGGDFALTFVVVTKRHHTRFYATDGNHSYPYIDKFDGQVVNGNVKPYFFVDDQITVPHPPNFYLQSHKAIKGTGRSAHYFVLEDGMALYPAKGEGRLKPLPNLTNMLCHAFARATKGVSYAAPAYIADRLCERGRVYLRPWSTTASMQPIFKLDRDDKGKPTVTDKDELTKLKHEFAQQLASTRSVWGPHYNNGPAIKEETRRLNPWHPNLDQGMFWM